ncbi:MAG: APC family permease [Elusimicrobiota bacterium]
MDSAGLKRVIGLPGAVLLGLGSIIGTGVFVSIGLAAGIVGAWALPALALAALIALFNGLSSAQLAASHPTSGGSYEYGYQYLHPAAGFAAGWMFLCAKSASAATAALGGAGYILALVGAESQKGLSPLAAGLTISVMILLLTGMRRSNKANAAIVGLTLVSLSAFVLMGFFALPETGIAELTSALSTPPDPRSFLHATALLFVAYTGYGRIATLGEEVVEPGRTIPRAVLSTLTVTVILYAAVAFIAIASVGAHRYGELTQTTGAPLEEIARNLDLPGIPLLLAVGAVTAMLGVLLNLNLGLSRVLLAMGRRGDMPKIFSRVSKDGGTPVPAVITTALMIVGLVAIGSVKTTWSFSAFTVLVYYAITNLAALRLPEESQRYPRWIAGAGLAGCAFLAFWVEPAIWIAGLATLAVGMAWHGMASLQWKK